MTGQEERIDRQTIFLGIVCWITYFSLYLGRLNFSASMSEMVHLGICLVCKRIVAGSDLAAHGSAGHGYDQGKGFCEHYSAFILQQSRRYAVCLSGQCLSVKNRKLGTLLLGSGHMACRDRAIVDCLNQKAGERTWRESRGTKYPERCKRDMRKEGGSRAGESSPFCERLFFHRSALAHWCCFYSWHLKGRFDHMDPYLFDGTIFNPAFFIRHAHYLFAGG